MNCGDFKVEIKTKFLKSFLEDRLEVIENVLNLRECMVDECLIVKKISILVIL